MDHLGMPITSAAMPAFSPMPRAVFRQPSKKGAIAGLYK